jgi:type IV pilus assembly protein PilA
MLQRLRHRAQGQEGFTLIELLVVILIIGILAGVAIPVFLSQTSKANGANAISDINSAATAEETYYTTNQNYVSAIPGSTVSPVATITAITPSLTNAMASTSKEALTINALNSSGVIVTSTTTPATGVGYQISASDPSQGATTGVTYTYTKLSSGQVNKTCSVPSGVSPGSCVNPASTTAGW